MHSGHQDAVSAHPNRPFGTPSALQRALARSSAGTRANGSGVMVSS
jgi:hypothetical protein